MALTAIGGSFFASVLTFVSLAYQGGEHDHVRLTWTAWEWMHTTGGLHNAPVPIDMRFSVDALSGTMMLIVTGVGFLIHLYATAYMAKDDGFARFFAYMNLFVFAMLVLILGDNLPVMFVGWEGVGLCSYLLIGFWFEQLPNAAAGKKAFIANRIGDFGLICAMFLLVHYTGSLDWVGMSADAHNLVDNPTDKFQVHIWPPGGGSYTDFHAFGLTLPLHWLNPTKNGMPAPFTITAATAVGLSLLLGCTGKSAQIPLYIWLPDAMAGPTPVSALIHAATMVTAGVYLVCRMSFVFVLSPFVMASVALIGALTALLAASIALVQNDIKKVLAYSTVSQLGFMFIGVGVGAFTAGFFHVITHAFFKGCLFLGAGSVIHAMHGRIHDHDASQDMRNMGGLGKYMPYTRWTFLISTAAIIGCPGLSGFFSKDEILYRAYVNHSVNPFATRLQSFHVEMWAEPTWFGPMIYFMGVAAAAMTAFYMVRCYILTFEGDFRGWTIGRSSSFRSDPDFDLHDHTDDDDAHGAHHEENLKEPGPAPHESPRSMTLPLIILATFAGFAGVLNPAPFTKKLPLEHWLEPVFESTKDAVAMRAGADGLTWILMIGGIVAFASGTGLAYWMYIIKQGEPAKALAASQPALHRFLLDKWRVDELYDWAVVGVLDALADTFAAVDIWLVDGIIARLTSVIVAGLGSFLRIFQTGVVQTYAAIMVVCMACLGWFFVAPHPDASFVETNGDYTITAGPGIGYQYRWDADGNGSFDSDKYSDQTTVKVHVDAGKSKTVRLEVKNAFGLTRSAPIELTRPASEGSAQVVEV
ncbi:MAG: NADH-quinone oxidoreductase subunit L, partial [Polyangiaceae bacterium]